MNYLSKAEGFIVYNPATEEFWEQRSGYSVWGKSPKIWSKLSTIKGTLTRDIKLDLINDRLDPEEYAFVVVDITTNEVVIDCKIYVQELLERREQERHVKNY